MRRGVWFLRWGGDRAPGCKPSVGSWRVKAHHEKDKDGKGTQGHIPSPVQWCRARRLLPGRETESWSIQPVREGMRRWRRILQGLHQAGDQERIRRARLWHHYQAWEPRLARSKGEGSIGVHQGDEEAEAERGRGAQRGFPSECGIRRFNPLRRGASEGEQARSAQEGDNFWHGKREEREEARSPQEGRKGGWDNSHRGSFRNTRWRREGRWRDEGRYERSIWFGFRVGEQLEEVEEVSCREGSCRSRKGSSKGREGGSKGRR